MDFYFPSFLVVFNKVKDLRPPPGARQGYSVFNIWLLPGGNSL